MAASAAVLAAPLLLFLGGKLDLPRPPAGAGSGAPEPRPATPALAASGVNGVAYRVGSWANYYYSKKALERSTQAGRTLPAVVWRSEDLRLVLLLPLKRTALDLNLLPVAAVLRLDLGESLAP